ncbi:uncharacterized protein LOC119466658 isoform X2 [Dermacentor silvarum]|uniref:uncharacterized protein LOC119466658 isoform X2 n=1 Tax=Dermacentor silvarum TaxID=543639 RepID=UPI0021013625|nr:uncharacterized protein LOC119466658 isoform X2 [Dermacentor silvarum]
MSSAAEGTSRSHVSAASGRQAPGPGDAPVDERTVGLVKLFMSTLLPDFSPRGAVYAVALVLAVCYAGIVLAGVIRKAPSSPFRCDDPSLQAAQEKDVLPTAPYVALVFASSVTVVFVNEFRRASASWTEATYWTARHLRRFFVGFVVTGVHRRSESELSPGDGDEEPYSEGNGDANDRAITALAENSNVTNAPRSPAVWTVQQPGGAPRPSPEGHVGDSYIAFGTNGASGAGGDARYYYRHVDLISDWVPPTGDVTDYRCTGPKGRKSGASFPSGHATVAAFAGVFMLGYGIRRFANFHQPFRAAFLAWALGTCVWLVCAQRVVQHKHFLIDVVCGSAFGSAVAAAFVLWPYEDDKDRHANAGR